MVPILYHNLSNAGNVRYFWVRGSFVHMYGVQRFTCWRSGHGSACQDIAAVKAFLGLDGSSAPAYAAAVQVEDEQPPAFDAAEDEVAGENLPAFGGRFPFPSSEEDCDRMHRLRTEGPPAELRPELPSVECGCGLTYNEHGYRLLNAACPVYCPLPVGLQVELHRIQLSHAVCVLHATIVFSVLNAAALLAARARPDEM